MPKGKVRVGLRNNSLPYLWAAAAYDGRITLPCSSQPLLALPPPSYLLLLGLQALKQPHHLAPLLCQGGFRHRKLLAAECQLCFQALHIELMGEGGAEVGGGFMRDQRE